MIATLLALAAAATPALFGCGAVERPGIAEIGADGVWRGVAVDLCRQAAQAAHRPAAAIAFRPYRSIGDLRDARHDRLMVLSRAELAIAWPGAAAPPGPPVASSRQVLLVSNDTSLRTQAQLAGQRVCFIAASPAEAALNTWAHVTRIAIQRAAFQEPLEQRDAFDAGYCPAMAVDARAIPGGTAHTQLIGPPLAELPLFAVLSVDTAR